MIESDVWKALISVLRSGLDSNGLSQVEIHQAYQPIKQGPSSTDSIYLHKITSQRVGHQGRKYEYNSVNDNFDETEKYWLSVTIQLMSQVTQDLSDVDSITAYDVTEKCAAIMQTRNTRQALLASGISILNNKAISVAFSTDDKDQFDLDPTFDMVLLYEQTLLSVVPKAYPIEGEIIEVDRVTNLGPELVIGGRFSDPSKWNLGAGWTISGGVATCDGTASVCTNIGVALEIGKTFRTVFGITAFISGVNRMRLGATLGPVHGGIDVFTDNITATGSNNLSFQSGTNFIGSIDNVSVREIL